MVNFWGFFIPFVCFCFVFCLAGPQGPRYKNIISIPGVFEGVLEQFKSVD